MFLYAELGEVKLITAHFNDMESAESQVYRGVERG